MFTISYHLRSQLIVLRLIFSFTLASYAKPAKFKLMRGNFKAGAFGYMPFEFVMHRFINIKHPAAGFATKMVVISAVCLEPADLAVKV